MLNTDIPKAPTKAICSAMEDELQAVSSKLLYSKSSSLNRRVSLVNQLYTHHPTVVSLSETWLSENTDSSQIFPGSNYIDASRSDRGEGKHGGVLLAVQSGVYDLYSYLDLSMSKIDFGCACAVNLPEIWYLFITLYIPPRSSAYSLESVNVLEFISTTISQFRNLIMNS